MQGGFFVINTAKPTVRHRLVYSAASDLGERRPPAAARDSLKSKGRRNFCTSLLLPL